MRYTVITRVPDPTEGGNLAVRPDVMVQTEPPGESNGWMGRHVTAFDALGMNAIALRVPVFTLGEVLIVGDDGRELVGERRQPGKWDVGAETFDTIEEAVARAQAVQP